MRRNLLLIALIIVVLGLGVWTYFAFTKSSTVLTVTPGADTTLPTADTGATGSDATVSGAEPVQPQTVTARLVKVSAGPVVPGVSVATVLAKSASTSPSTTVFFVERRSGNIYAYGVQEKTLTRTSNRTIPGIQSATWTPNASSTIVRYLSGTDSTLIDSYLLPANGGPGAFLSQNIADVAASPAGILTLASGVNGSIASLARLDGSKATQVFSTPLTALRIGFSGKGKYLAFTKPSVSLPGAAFTVDGAGTFTRLAGPLPGLVALASPSGAWILVSFTVGTSLQMELVNTATGETVPLPLATIADKCAWSADSATIYCGVPQTPSPSYAYPDDWYQGATSFQDRIWKIQVAGRYAQLVLDFEKEAGTALDALSLAVDNANSTLVFLNKNDGSLWSYSL